MSTQDAFDHVWAEMLVTRFMCQQLYAFLAVANRDKPDWLAKQRVMLLNQIDALRLDGHPDPDHMRALARAALERTFQELAQSLIVPGTVQ